MRDRFNIGDGSKCQSICEEMKCARKLAAAMLTEMREKVSIN